MAFLSPIVTFYSPIAAFLLEIESLKLDFQLDFFPLANELEF